MDGSSNKYASEAGVVLTSPNDMELQYALCFNFQATNNKAEYEVVLAGINMAHFLGADGVVFHNDSQLVVRQVIGEFATKDNKMKEYLLRVLEFKGLFKHFLIEQIPREENCQVDSLAQMAYHPDEPTSNPRVPLEVLEQPSICYEHAIYQVSHTDWWGGSITRFLQTGALLTNKVEAQNLRMQDAWYKIQMNILYKRGFP